MTNHSFYSVLEPPAAKDLSTLHDCQDVLERALIDAKAKIEDKLAGLTTENGKALFAEFESTLNDHISDTLNDTLDAWAVTKKSEVEGGEWNVPTNEIDIEQTIAHAAE